MMNIQWLDKAWDEYLDWQNADRKTLRKINSLIKDISRNGYQCAGKPEQLKGDFAGFWSVRIDKKNRIVFRIVDGNVEVIQCSTHYGN
ncbi:MAG: Txe/YoeB family addiction module toxin [Phascolarctobacterium sp.]|nr:Txe/YoeB family addiction module toxin [Phascolarctobacterium sp.]